MLAVRSFWFYLGAPKGRKREWTNALIHNIGKKKERLFTIIRAIALCQEWGSVLVTSRVVIV
jgi:hypothetical protein